MRMLVAAALIVGAAAPFAGSKDPAYIPHGFFAGSEGPAYIPHGFFAESKDPAYSRYEFSSLQMGTLARVVLYARDAETARDGSSRAFARIASLDAVMSDYREDSELTRLSRRAGDGPVRVSDDLFRVLEASVRVWRDSRGAFDVTAAPLIHLWRRARRIGQLPDRREIAAAAALTGSDKMILNARDQTVDLRVRGMQIDLGGIGKGFAAQEAATLLRRRGYRDVLVALGGDIVAVGAPPRTTGWTIDVADLSTDASAPQRIVLREAAVSTSGDAEQWVEIDGVRYSHIVDPRDGKALTGRRSVTVVAPTGTMSDALATAVSVMGPVDGLALIDRTPNAAARISTAEGEAIRRVASRRWRYFVAAGSGPISTLRNSTSAPSA